MAIALSGSLAASRDLRWAYTRAVMPGVTSKVLFDVDSRSILASTYFLPPSANVDVFHGPADRMHSPLH